MDDDDDDDGDDARAAADAAVCFLRKGQLNRELWEAL
jgi:hypothetical protein